MTVCDRPGAEAQARPESLDPEDWDEALAVARQILDGSVAYLRDVRERPVWRPMPRDVLAAFEAPLPRNSEPLSDVWREVAADGRQPADSSSRRLPAGPDGSPLAASHARRLAAERAPARGQG